MVVEFGILLVVGFGIPVAPSDSGVWVVDLGVPFSPYGSRLWDHCEQSELMERIFVSQASLQIHFIPNTHMLGTRAFIGGVIYLHLHLLALLVCVTANASSITFFEAHSLLVMSNVFSLYSRLRELPNHDS